MGGREAPFGVGIWVYAINLKLKRIVAAQVEAITQRRKREDVAIKKHREG